MGLLLRIGASDGIDRHWCFIPTGNCSTGDFSTPLRCARNDREGEYHCVSYRQETVGEGFPIVVLHIGASYRQETIRPEISLLRFRPSK